MIYSKINMVTTASFDFLIFASFLFWGERELCRRGEGEIFAKNILFFASWTGLWKGAREPFFVGLNFLGERQLRLIQMSSKNWAVTHTNEILPNIGLWLIQMSSKIRSIWFLIFLQVFYFEESASFCKHVEKERSSTKRSCFFQVELVYEKEL